jgi:hypothetical protein
MRHRIDDCEGKKSWVLRHSYILWWKLLGKLRQKDNARENLELAYACSQPISLTKRQCGETW